MPRSTRLLRVAAGAEDRRLFQIAEGVSKGISRCHSTPSPSSMCVLLGSIDCIGLSSSSSSSSSFGVYELLLTAREGDFSAAL